MTDVGFDQVTVTEIAAAAEVAEKTVYNHFPVKAALVFDAADELLTDLLEVVRGRGAGVPAIEGIRGLVTRRAERAERGAPPRPSRGFLQLIEARPALQSYRREMFARWESALSGVLAEDTGAAPGAAEPFVAGAAFVAVLRAGLEAPTPGGTPVEHNSLAALDLLTRGLSDYASAPTGPVRACPVRVRTCGR